MFGKSYQKDANHKSVYGRFVAVIMGIVYKIDDGLSYLRKSWVLRFFRNFKFKPFMVGFFVMFALILLYRYGNDILDFAEMYGGYVCETRVVTDKIQAVRNGYTYFYLVSGNGQTMSVNMSDYLSTKVGDKREGVWTDH